MDLCIGIKSVKNVSVTTEATRLLDANPGRRAVRIFNNGSAAIFVGPTDQVTKATGFPIPNGTGIIDEHSADAWYAIIAADTADVRVMEIV